MTNESKIQIIDAGTLESEEFQPSEEIRQEFEEAARFGEAGTRKLNERLAQHTDSSPALSGGDVDAAWEASDVGEESVGGENPTPDQNVVAEIGEAVGLSYDDAEPLKPEDKIAERDLHRWELHPASSEGFTGRSKNEGEYEEK